MEGKKNLNSRQETARVGKAMKINKSRKMDRTAEK